MHAKIRSTGLAAVVAVMAFLASAYAGEGYAEILTNANIIDLTRANVSQELILSKITTSRNTFDTSTRALITLKENGVSDPVINAMVAASMTSGMATVDQNRLRVELRNIASGDPEAKNNGLAWMLANRDQALPAVRQALADADADTRDAALQVLAWFKDQQSLPAVRNLLTDPSPRVRQTTAQTLVALDDPQVRNAAELALNRQVNPLDGYIRVFGYARLAHAAGLLGQVLSSNPNPLNRAAAAWALGEIGRAGIEGRAALEAALVADTDASVRREAALAVAKYHDGESARLLQEACRRDPEVRKITLAAMAEYPETVGFLVWVMNLGTDVIAADELETARISLNRLTGQDFRLDGAGWEEWFTANRSRFPGTTTAAPPPAPTTIMEPASTASIPTAPMGMGIPPLVQTPTNQVDLEAWSLVANPSGIPMAPEVDGDAGRSGPRFSPAPQWETHSGQTSVLPMPTSLSPDDFGAPSLQFSPLDATSSHAQTPGASFPPAPDGDGSGGQSMFRTWTSDPERGATQAPARETRTVDDLARGAFGPYGADDAEMEWRDETEVTGGPDFSSPYSGSGAGMTGSSLPAFESSALPAAPIVSPIPASTGADSEPLRGIALPLPPMDMGASGSSPDESGVYGQPDFSSPFAMPEVTESMLRPPASTTPVRVDDSAASLAPVGAADPFASVDGMDFSDVLNSADLPVGDSDWQDSLITDMGSVGEYVAPAFEPAVPDDGSFSFGAPMPDPASGEVTVYRAEPVPFDSAGTPDTSGFPVLPMPPGDGSGGASVSPPADYPGAGGGSIFVEPEPGQVVIGEALAGPGVDGQSESYAAPEYTPWQAPEAEPTQSYGDYGGYDETNPYGDVQVTGPDGLEYAEDVPAALSEAAPEAPAYLPETTPAAQPVYPEVQQVYQPPAPLGTSSTFTDPSAPMPPVKVEGTLTAPKGKDMPPMLGEGMFKK